MSGFDIVQLSSISFRRGETVILHDIDWTVQSGQHWALLGANGSGKTTLLKIITGYEWPTEGQVSVLGQCFGDCVIGDLRKTIGWISQDVLRRIPGHIKTIDVVLCGLDAALGVYREFSDEEHGRAYQALTSAGGHHTAQKPFGLLSQGEQQRVLIARALMTRPRLLILDEPCVGLDPAARYHFLSDLSAMARQEICPGMIYVTHHIEEIQPFMTHALILKSGEVLAGGPMADCLTDALMSKAFNMPCQVRHEAGNSRYMIDIS